MAEDTVRTRSVCIRLTPNEKMQIIHAAKKAGNLKLSEFLRRAVLSTQVNEKQHKSVPELNRQAYYQLGEIHKLLEAVSNTDVAENGSEVLESLKQLLIQVRQDLLGFGDGS